MDFHASKNSEFLIFFSIPFHMCVCTHTHTHTHTHIYIYMCVCVCTINQVLMVTASAVEINLDIISVQEHSYHHCELELKYHDTGNGWTFDLASVLKKSLPMWP